MQCSILTLIELNVSKLLLGFLIAFIGGLCVKYYRVRVNYTRKINHFFLFFIPPLIDNLTGYIDPVSISINEIIFGLGSLLIFTKPVRTRISLIATAFSSFDRPEDRPYTLLWYLMQEVAGYAVFMPAMIIFERYNMAALLGIPVLISLFGDGLAEPVGVLFGKHRYLTYALFCKKKYMRTLEGSFMVFISAVIITAFFYWQFSQMQFIAAMLTTPLLMTLSEAFSPHTIDNPLMMIVGSANIFLIKYFI